MRLVLLLAVATLIGCAPMERSQSFTDTRHLAFEKDAQGNEYIVGAKYSYNLTKASFQDELPICVSQHVENRSVTIKGSTTVIGAYTGNLYNPTVGETFPGAQAIRYVSDDRKSIIAEGSSTYESGMPFVSRNIRYVVKAEIRGQALNLDFTKLEHAQVNSGVASNNGYGKLGSWAGATPDKAIAQLKSISDSIYQCIAIQ